MYLFTLNVTLTSLQCSRHRHASSYKYVVDKWGVGGLLARAKPRDNNVQLAPLSHLHLRYVALTALEIGQKPGEDVISRACKGVVHLVALRGIRKRSRRGRRELRYAIDTRSRPGCLQVEKVHKRLGTIGSSAGRHTSYMFRLPQKYGVVGALHIISAWNGCSYINSWPLEMLEVAKGTWPTYTCMLLQRSEQWYWLGLVR